jgi:hypothetical protein
MGPDANSGKGAYLEAVSLLLNQRPAPTAGILTLPRARPVWVACLWDHSDGRVKEVVPAVATHRAGDLVLCDFWDPRSGESREHWVEKKFVRNRPILAAQAWLAPPAVIPLPPASRACPTFADETEPEAIA